MNVKAIQLLKRTCLFFLLISLYTLVSICNAATSTVGIVLLHGKGGMPESRALSNLIRNLEGQGFIVVTPQMPYSANRGFDRHYEETATEIDQSVAELKQRGVNRVFILGHSLGANVAIYYATVRTVDGVVAMAPGHLPETDAFYKNCGSSVALAKEMVREGNGDKKALFDDLNLGRQRKIETTGNIYLSWFDPDGAAIIPKNSASLKPGTALFWVVGRRDNIIKRGQEYAYDRVPKNPNNKYLAIDSDHVNTPKDASGEIINWIKEFKYNAHAGETFRSGQLPIVDAHGHIGASFNVTKILEDMDRNGVSKQIVMARAYPGKDDSDLPGDDQLSLKLAETYPGRFYPLVGMQRPLLTGAHKWTTPDPDIEALIRQTESKLASGKFFGIGEFIVRHWAYSPGIHAEQDNPIYSELMRRFSVLAAKYDVPMVIHMEGYPTLVADFSKLITENPSTRYVWAHSCGRSKAEVIRRLLSRFQNLFCDLGGMTNVTTGYGSGWPRKEEFTSLIERSGVLFPEMKSLYEEFPDRFMVGTDVAHAPAMRFYEGRIRRFRELLEQLSPETRAKIAEQNAIRIFRLAR